MFVISFTTMVVMNCVIVLNVSLRTPNTHKMSDGVRRVRPPGRLRPQPPSNHTPLQITNPFKSQTPALPYPLTPVVPRPPRQIFLNILPRLLRMQMKPWTPPDADGAAAGGGDWAGGKPDPRPAGNGGTDRLTPCRHHRRRRSSMGLMVKAEEYVLKTARTELMFSRLRERQGLIRTVFEKLCKRLSFVFCRHRSPR